MEDKSKTIKDAIEFYGNLAITNKREYLKTGGLSAIHDRERRNRKSSRKVLIIFERKIRNLVEAYKQI